MAYPTWGGVATHKLPNMCNLVSLTPNRGDDLFSGNLTVVEADGHVLAVKIDGHALHARESPHRPLDGATQWLQVTSGTDRTS